MRVPIEGFDLVIATVITGLFVLPTLWHLASDLRDRPGRNFSLIPHKKRHLAAGLVRLGLVGGAGVAATSIANPAASFGIWSCLVFLLLFWNLVGSTDRRLTIDAGTGLVRWTKISLPWWPTVDGNSSFVDAVGRVRYESRGDKLNLLNVGSLERYTTSSYNGAISSSGHYSDNTLLWVAEQVNDYLEAFKRHDTSSAREARSRYREQVEAERAPGRQRRTDRAVAASMAAVNKKKRREAKAAARAASKERSRMRRVEAKFQE